MTPHNLRLVALATVAVCIVAIPTRAEAQLGSLIRKAKEKVAEQVLPQQESAAAAALGDPFDAGTLEAAMKGMQVYKTRIADAAALNKSYMENQAKYTALLQSGKKAAADFRANDDAIRRCIDADFDAHESERALAMQSNAMKAMSDPAKRNAVMKLTADMQAAQAKGDIEAVKKTTEAYATLLGIQADSAAAFKKCGKPPVKPASMVETERLEKANEDLTKRMRVIESSADIDGARSAGVDPAKFQKMRERLVTFTESPKSFSGAEKELLTARKAEIIAVLQTP